MHSLLGIRLALPFLLLRLIDCAALPRDEQTPTTKEEKTALEIRAESSAPPSSSISTAPASTNSAIAHQNPLNAAFFFGGGLFVTLGVSKQVHKDCVQAKPGSQRDNDCGHSVSQTVVAAALTLGGTAYVFHRGFAPPGAPPRRSIEATWTMFSDIELPVVEHSGLMDGHAVSIAHLESVFDEEDVEHRFYSLRTRAHSTNQTYEGMIYHRPHDNAKAFGLHNVHDSEELSARGFPPGHVVAYYAASNSDEPALKNLNNRNHQGYHMGDQGFNRVYKYDRRETCASIELHQGSKSFEANKGVFAILFGKTDSKFLKKLPDDTKQCGHRNP